jgi:hypothetical protein
MEFTGLIDIVGREPVLETRLLREGKLHALSQRRYLKRRDLYVLLWYLSDPDWPDPNFTLLQNALRQTTGIRRSQVSDRYPLWLCLTKELMAVNIFPIVNIYINIKK